MSSLDEIQGLINSAKEELADSRKLKEQVEHETVQALHRQQMRRQLDVIREAIHANQCSIASSRAYRERIDSDSDGTFMPGKPRPAQDSMSCGRPAGEVTTYSKVVDRHEYVWKIEGMSWLVAALKKRAQSVAAAEQPFLVGDTSFECVYHPRNGEIGDENQRGSLAIIHNESGGITFRHQFWIKRSDGEFVQWGATTEESHPLSDTLGRAFGPDVHEGNGSASTKVVGIFGLTHEHLLRSEWVSGDALTVKIKVEVLPPEDGFFTKTVKTSRVDVPGSSLCQHLRQLFDSGKGADVTFLVKGEAIQAHSQILLARSDVFASELLGGMQESISKEVVVEDCEGDIFKAMLKFLYTDDFDHIQELVEHVSKTSKQSSDSRDSRSANLAKVSAEIQLLHQLLQVSHRYEVARLRLWCEQRLCNRMTVSEVSGVLCQAHLFDAKQLQRACLAFIKENLEAVALTPGFLKLTTDWPEVMLKVTLFNSGLSDVAACPVVEAQRECLRGLKRKRFQ